MTHALSFSPEFFWGRESAPGDRLRASSRPTSVCDAILNLSQETWDALAEEVFGIDPAELDLSMVVSKIAATNTCRNLDSPVEVFIDTEGDFTVLVYDNPAVP